MQLLLLRHFEYNRQFYAMGCQNLFVHSINQTLTYSAKECTEPLMKRKKYLWKENGRSSDPIHFFLLEEKIKTAELRRPIRIEIARRRQAGKISIVNAKKSDSTIFHHLIRKQGRECHQFLIGCCLFRAGGSFINSLIIVAPIVLRWFCAWSLFCFAVH